ncbi:hypothetical protein OIU78_023116 [Salix suchowensis]|nr:hypothetical protein OIU78_023116 [Salix suchowensis]
MMLRMTNGEGDTALHEAARNSRGHVVEILTKEDSDFSYSANVHGETPLYIAASADWGPEHDKVIDSILRNCISVDYGGPNGRTALHAAITARDDGKLLLIGFVGFSDNKKDISKRKEIDKKQPMRTAGHHFTTPPISLVGPAVNLLLECDASRCLHCSKTTEKKEHASSHCRHSRRCSHNGRDCFPRVPELERLKTEKDDKGNTPFHLIAALTHKQKGWNKVYPYNNEQRGIYGLNKQKLSITNMRGGDFGEIQKEIVESLEDIGSGPFGFGPTLFSREKVKNREKIEEDLNKARESHQVVAALIATVTFAAAFTLPGGYKSDQGTAILAKKVAFMVFVISDAISMVLSISAVFIHFLLALYQGSFSQTSQAYQTTAMLFAWAKFFTMTGMGTMIIAFVAGIFAVLEPVLGLAISICLIGFSFFFLVCWIIYKDKDRRFTTETTNSKSGKQHHHL